VWTVDDPEVARRLVGYGVDGITSNRAAALRAALGLR
jgi:glycerophosphoryl diester phosphodiesterase